MDFQGLRNNVRPEIRRNRIEWYTQVELRGTNTPLETVANQIYLPKSHANFKFKKFWQVSPHFEHFQLRHLLNSTGNDVYFYNGLDIARLSTTQTFEVLFKLESGCSTLNSSEEMLICGTYDGNVVVLPMGSNLQNIPISTSIVNFVMPKGSGALACCNDGIISSLDVENGSHGKFMALQWAPNCIAQSSLNMLAVVGDNIDCLLVDCNGTTIHLLPGHIDYCFACAFSPCSRYLITASQDLTSRYYDVRWLSKPLAVFGSTMASVRSVAFSPTGMLCLTESADYTHFIDQNLSRQTVEFIGDTSGCAFSNTGSVYVGISGSFPGILEMNPIDRLTEENLLF